MAPRRPSTRGLPRAPARRIPPVSRSVLAGTLLVLASSACALLAPAGLPAPGSASARWLERGHGRVVTADVELHDVARDRSLPTRLWWPEGVAGPLPLVVQSHGYLGNRNGGAYLARDLARRGYVVAAATHPKTTLLAHGGARIDDVTEQPGDVSFVIDWLLDERFPGPPHPRIDPSRIAVMGHSLGGLTAVLAAFDPHLRDRRIRAAISIGGPLAMFEPRFFASAAVPLLMIAGSFDVVVDYRRHALATFGMAPDETLVLIAGASHVGFDDAMTGLPRLLDNPDTLGCWGLAHMVDLDAARAKLDELGREDEGIDRAYRIEVPCLVTPPPVAMDTARQHVLTTLAVTAFLDSRLAADPRLRMQAYSYLTSGFVRENPEVSVIATSPSETSPQTGDGGG